MFNFNVKIQLFGALRELKENGFWQMSVTHGTSLFDLKKLMIQTISEAQKSSNIAEIITSSALANEHEILHDTTIITGNIILMMLPPVSGG